MDVEDLGDAVRVTRTVLFGDCDPAAIAYTPKIIDFAVIALDEFWKIALGGKGWFELNIDHDIGTAFVDLRGRFAAPITPRAPVTMTVRVARKGEKSISFVIEGVHAGRLAFTVDATCVFIRRSLATSIKPPSWIEGGLQRFVAGIG